MHRLAQSLIVAGLLLAPVSAYAADATTVLNVHNASCPLCPGIVKGALSRVNGVKSVEVSDADASGNITATVDYDNALATPDALIKATTNQGYPADVKS